MEQHYRDYQWRRGKPQGLQKCLSQTETTYRILHDGYYKRITVEEYCEGQFSKVIYDSSLLDFRKLNQRDQMAWSREIVFDNADRRITLIRDIDDRVILKEEMGFQKDLCVECRLVSPTGFQVGMQKVLYTVLGDPFNGVVLYDNIGKTVLEKKYQIDEMNQFTDLISETS